MDKLIELLNEYNEIHNYAPIEYYDDGTNGFETNYVAFYKTCIIISKQFGFIKWLVENDKIDNKKIADETYVKVNGEWYELILGCHYDLYQQTLMLLSISDTPIDDLISYLK